MNQRLLLSLYTLSPTHVGAGKDLGVVDLPIQRERISQHPIFYGSTLKGALRQETPFSQEIKNVVFGPEPQDSGKGSEYASCVAFSDARLLAFPMRSLFETFVWVTSPIVLKRFQRDLALTGFMLDFPDELFHFQGDALICSDSEKALTEPENKQLVLEESVLNISKSEKMGKFAQEISKYLPSLVYFEEKFSKHLVVVQNEIFDDFVAFHTEIIARVCLNKEKTVKAGPWYEENLPSECLLYSSAVVKKPRTLEEKSLQTEEDVVKTLLDTKLDSIQIGGNETVGRGIVALKFFKKQAQLERCTNGKLG